jgi:hypothetical protein
MKNGAEQWIWVLDLSGGGVLRALRVLRVLLAEVVLLLTLACCWVMVTTVVAAASKCKHVARLFASLLLDRLVVALCSAPRADSLLSSATLTPCALSTHAWPPSVLQCTLPPTPPT